MKLAKRGAAKPLGTHTAVGHLHDLKKWKDIDYLRDNGGMLPPFIIAVGSRVRVKKCPEIMNLKDAVHIDEAAGKLHGLQAYGRVAELIGTSEVDGFSFPLMIVETQMGCPATQINLRETLYFADDAGYNLDGRWIKSNGIYVARAGTAGGVNSFDSTKKTVKIGDILIGNSNYGSVGAVIQSYLQDLNFVGHCIADRVEKLTELMSELRGLALSADGLTLRTTSSEEVVSKLRKVAIERGVRFLEGNNYTKDSLYAEMDEETFAELRDTYGIIGTEMEALAIDMLRTDFAKAGINVYTGLVNAAIGAIPGKSFPETDEEKLAAHKAEENALLIARDALGKIAKELNS